MCETGPRGVAIWHHAPHAMHTSFRPRSGLKPQCLLPAPARPPLAFSKSGSPASLENEHCYISSSLAQSFHRNHLPLCFQKFSMVVAFSSVSKELSRGLLFQGNTFLWQGTHPRPSSHLLQLSRPALSTQPPCLPLSLSPTCKAGPLPGRARTHRPHAVTLVSLAPPPASCRCPAPNTKLAISGHPASPWRLLLALSSRLGPPLS